MALPLMSEFYFFGRFCYLICPYRNLHGLWVPIAKEIFVILDCGINLCQKCVIFILVMPFFDIPNMWLCSIELRIDLLDNLSYFLGRDRVASGVKNILDDVMMRKWNNKKSRTSLSAWAAVLKTDCNAKMIISFQRRDDDHIIGYL